VGDVTTVAGGLSRRTTLLLALTLRGPRPPATALRGPPGPLAPPIRRENPAQAPLSATRAGNSVW